MFKLLNFLSLQVISGKFKFLQNIFKNKVKASVWQ